MAILNYGNQFKYNGSGYVDSKMAPVETVNDLVTDVNELSLYYTPGMRITVLNDGEFGTVEYFLNDDYEWKRFIDLNNLSLSLDKGNYDGDKETDYLLQLHYTNNRNELVALGEAINLSMLLDDVESRIETLENKPEIKFEDTNTFISNAEVVLNNEEEDGLFIKFTYNNGNVLYTDITSLQPKTYENGIGVLIGEDNVISINEEWFETWFQTKIGEFNTRLTDVETVTETLKTNLATLSETLLLISGKANANESEIAKINSKLLGALQDIIGNTTTINEVKEEVEANTEQIEENKQSVMTLAETLAKIRGVEYIKAGNNIEISEDEEGNKVISAVVPEIEVPEVDLTPIENRLDVVEETVNTHSTEISSLQEAIKNLTPEGSGITGDNETIKTNDSGSLSVMISQEENNAIQKKNDGIFVQSIEIMLGDDEINAEENN